MTMDAKTAGLPTPVHLLTGFLGSGKTTLLQRLLTDPALSSTAVLINEFGEIGLDHHLLDRIDDTVVLMKSGCLCCTVRGEIAEALLNLHSLRARGKIDWFERVVIETTGLADPYPVLSTVHAHPVLRSHFSAGSTITTVDAVNGNNLLETRLEAIRQVAAADVMILTKTDLAGSDIVADLRRKLATINPTAELRLAAEADAGALLAEGGVRPTPALTHALSNAPADGHRRAHFHVAGGVKSFSMVVDGEVNWTAFGVWLTMLLNRHGDRVLRIKGILSVAGEDRPVAIHGVQRLVHPPVHMSAWPDANRQSRLVFVLEGLDPEAIRESFSVFNSLSNSSIQTPTRVQGNPMALAAM